MTESVLHLFEGYGVELEYMIVHRDDLSVRPISDRLLHSIAGVYENQIDWERICLSNELVLHVVEFKTNGPMPSLLGLTDSFQYHIRDINRRLEAFDARLMPGAMHPWMNPERDTRLWPHNFNTVYETYNRIFNCQGHGWSNLQSAHINLPFANDDEFGRLHAAIRLVLPVLPALAASSPLVECRPTDSLDNRLEFYRKNSGFIPSVAGSVIPEAVFTRTEYDTQIFQRMYRDIAPFDAEGILRHEWLNARGAIARFDRGSIEIRLLDVQECSLADLAIVFAVISVLQALVSERWCDFETQKKVPTDSLASILLQTIRLAENTPIQDVSYLNLFGIDCSTCTAGELWKRILDDLFGGDRSQSNRELFEPLQIILSQGTLSSRILRRLGTHPGRERIAGVYGELCDCLDRGQLFLSD